MIIHVLTLFPEMFQGVLSESIMKRARERGAFDIRLHNFREQGLGVHKKVDDTPYGGGPGMVLRCEPVFAAMRQIEAEEHAAGRSPLRVLLCPQGTPLKQAQCREFAQCESMILLCGHYEGFDERIRLGFEWQEISIGDFVLTGGEIA
ncbi:MAG: tRNA (guanosine(37)-N1)-methyltransferase TrmD, partial [Planctomycetes bacterium]|nr:tRNA (guanosine(37)-N1)-methyltransferase TrmD [Planctomycetota bacterium]